MTQLFHYVPMRYVDVLCTEKEGLIPRTPLANEKFRQIGVEIPDGNYTFCFPDTPYPENWMKTGWLDRLVERIGEGLILTFEAPPSTLVLDASELYAVTARMRQLPLKDEADLDNRLQEFSSELKQAFKTYWDSRVPLAEYRNDYFLHEAIIDVTIPFEKLARSDYIDVGF